jgi:hypothetical protein
MDISLNNCVMNSLLPYYTISLFGSVLDHLIHPYMNSITHNSAAFQSNRKYNLTNPSFFSRLVPLPQIWDRVVSIYEKPYLTNQI